MANFRNVKTLQKFASLFMPQSRNHFSHERHLNAAIFSNKPEPPPWPSGVNLQPERPGLQVLQILSSSSDNAGGRMSSFPP